MEQNKVQGALAQFDDADALIAAAEKLRDAGYVQFDCHSPYAIHGMDDAMGEKPSVLPWAVALFALIGFAVGIGLQGWASAIEYPLITSGKLPFSYMAFFPITFACTVLFSGISTVVTMIVLIRQSFHHPVFYSENFAKATDDGFFVSILADDPQFDREATREFLGSIGGDEVELLEARGGQA